MNATGISFIDQPELVDKRDSVANIFVKCKATVCGDKQRAMRWVYVAIKHNKTAARARAFLKTLHNACPIRITHILTDNGKQFTDRLFANRGRNPSGNHQFDQLCQELSRVKLHCRP